MKQVLGGIAVVVASAVALVGLYVGGWWLYQNSVNRDAVIQRQNYNSQTTYEDQILKAKTDLARVDTQLAAPGIPADQAAALRGQRAAMTDQACLIAARITNPDTTVSAFTAANC